MYRLSIIIFFFCFIQLSLNAQHCETDSFLLQLQIRTDQFPFENAWKLTNLTSDQLIQQEQIDIFPSDTIINWSFCLSEKYCYEFSIIDDFLDGFKGNGYYKLFKDGALIRENSNFGREEKTEINCSPGSTCSNALKISPGIFSTPSTLPWFSFSADSVGSYFVSTCGRNDCDTRLWVYEDCDGLLISYDQAGAIYFDDNEGGCGQEAQIVNALLETGQTYFIRIGAVEESCGDSLHFELKYNGPISGCTDSTTCNFNPFATIDDGSCLPANDPNCPGAPDLTVNEQVLQESMFLDSIFNESDNCAIVEGCLRGYGKRDIIRFSTRISNIGQQDFYVGKLSDNQGQFDEDNCHMHPHYENYAEYLIFDAVGNPLPVGFKNGFCITDLDCAEGIDKKYSCANMGITAGCSDVYLSDLECQWVDVTDLQDGEYTLAIRINWNGAPDLLGRKEADYLNNWAQACFRLSRTSGYLEMEVISDCNDYVDCSGQVYGTARIDCKGQCNGTAIKGDYNDNGLLDSLDIDGLISAAAYDDVMTEPCYDLNGDGNLSIFDAALLDACLANQEGHNHGNGIFHPYCEFPKGLEKPQEAAVLLIGEVDYAAHSFDIKILNPQSNIAGFQFQLEGIKLLSVVDISSPSITIKFSDVNNIIAGLSPNGMPLQKSTSPLPVFRVFYEAISADSICIKLESAEAINDKLERINTKIITRCLPTEDPNSTDGPQDNLKLKVFPNPYEEQLNFQFNNPTQQVFQLQIFGITGQFLYEFKTRGNGFRILEQHLPKGILFYRLRSGESVASGKVVRFK